MNWRAVRPAVVDQPRDDILPSCHAPRDDRRRDIGGEEGEDRRVVGGADRHAVVGPGQRRLDARGEAVEVAVIESDDLGRDGDGKAETDLVETAPAPRPEIAEEPIAGRFDDRVETRLDRPQREIAGDGRALAAMLLAVEVEDADLVGLARRDLDGRRSGFPRRRRSRSTGGRTLCRRGQARSDVGHPDGRSDEDRRHARREPGMALSRFRLLDLLG